MAKKADPDAAMVQARLSHNLRRLMAKDGRTADKLEADASVSQKTVWKITSRRGLPSIMTLLRLCSALGCTPNEMLEGCGDLVFSRRMWRVGRSAG
jgi:DNA-binding Xre family transcriptional regulator